MIERILNKYYSKKLADYVLSKLMLISIDKKVKRTKDSFIILIKNKREKDEYYKEYMEIRFEEGLESLIYYLTTDFKFCKRASDILEAK